MNPSKYLLPTALALLAACAATPPPPTPAPAEPISASFEPRGQAGMERLQQDAMQRICSEYEGKPLPDELAAQLIASATEGVRFPADGRWLGDWKNGEKIAQTGTGLQSSDNPAVPNGGNCYACHQLAPAEIAFGTIGPSLTGYGRLRGNSEPILRYAWTRLYDAHAYTPCSHMPRFGARGILAEQQLKDVMAYLFDPVSPVNQAVPPAP